MSDISIIKSTSYQPFEVAKVVEYGPIPVTSDVEESLLFRIEILRSLDSSAIAFPRVWRIETYGIHATYPIDSRMNPPRKTWEKRIMVIDETEEWDDLRGTDVDAVLAEVLRKIEARFVGHTPESGS